MISAGLEEATPWQVALHENVRPKLAGLRLKSKGRNIGGANQVAEIAEERCLPRRQFDQQPGNGRGLRDLGEDAAF